MNTMSKMSNVVIKRIWVLLCLLILQSLNLVAVQNQILSIPSVRQWISTDGIFKFSRNSRIVISERDFASLISDIETFNEDLDQLKGYSLLIVKGDNPVSGDIFFSLGAKDSQLGSEGYTMKISDKIEIAANTETGASMRLEHYCNLSN